MSQQFQSPPQPNIPQPNIPPPNGPPYRPQPMPPYGPPFQPPGQEPRNAFGLVALILALVGLVFVLVPLTGFIALILGLVALVLAIVGLARVRRRVATNVKTTVVALVLSVLAIAGGVWGITIVFGALDDLDSALSDLGSEPSVSAKATPQASEPVPSPTEAASPEPAETADAPAALAVGETATVTENDVAAGEVTVTKSRSTGKPDSEYGEKPENGRFWVVTVNAKAIGSETFSVNPFDFYLRGSDGTHYDFANGNSMFAMDREMLDAVDLNPNEKVSGELVFDAPVGAAELVYAPQFRALGSWKLSAK